MPTSRTERQAGFTLVEMLAVLVILALAATAVVQGGRSSIETANVRAFLVEAEAMMRAARTTAIETMAVQDVVLDPEGRQLAFPAAGKVLKIPQGLSLEGQLASVPGSGVDGYVIRFYPAGNSSGATLPFRYRGQTYELRVIWLTGQVDVRQG
jgi:general secretion pathway protein H